MQGRIDPDNKVNSAKPPRLRIWIVVVCLAAGGSGLAIILHVLGWLALGPALTILAPLTILVLAGAVGRADSLREQILLNRIVGGLLAGFAGLVAYDAIRALILMSGIVPFNPFRAIEVYGLLILDTQNETPLTKALGWGFHIWNGLFFAVMYTVALGRGRMIWAIGWGLLLEVAMLATYPSMFQMAMDGAFIFIGVIGHLAYGVTLGLVAPKAVKY